MEGKGDDLLLWNCCGDVEDGSLAHDVENRAEAPATFEMISILALCEGNEWNIGALDIETASLHAELDDKDDGIYIVDPPAIMVKHCLVKEGAKWNLNNVLVAWGNWPTRNN